MTYAIPDYIIQDVDDSLKNFESKDINEIISTLTASVTSGKNSKKLPDPIEYLKSVMEERGLRNKDLKVYIGSSGNVCSVLKKRKPLSLRMIRNLHTYLGIPADILIQPYECK